MPLLATAEEAILKAMNTENNLDLKVAEVVFGVPAIPTEPDDVTKAQGLNSMVRIQALATANAIGATTVYYDRVDFADMFTGVDGIQPMRIPARLDAVFTAYRNLLTVDASGLPQWVGLRKILDDLGVPNYSGPLNSNTVQDVATTTAQFANKAYDRVVIQTGIDETGVKGVAYYHYNS